MDRLATFGLAEALFALSREGPRDAQRPTFAMAAAQSRATVEKFLPDGKSYMEIHAADADKGGCGELFLRHLSRSIALQRLFFDGITDGINSERCVESQSEQRVAGLGND
jgi:hypothetical protein